MIDVGRVNKLKVVKRVDHGFYLEGDDDYDDVLLPKKYVPEGLEVGDEIDVFIYFDSSDYIIATTLTPNAMVGEFASLKVSSVEKVGVFLDWGLEKDLFVPFREQVYEMHAGKNYVVYVYVDSSDRITASTRLTKFINKALPPFKDGEEVDLLLCQVTDLGIKAIVNGSHYGLLYKDDVINNLEVGDKVKGFIKKVRDDAKIDLSMRSVIEEDPEESKEDLAEFIIQKLKDAGGSLPITSKTPAETINSMFNVSRKKFKVALGDLYKKKIVSLDETSVNLVESSD